MTVDQPSIWYRRSPEAGSAKTRILLPDEGSMTAMVYFEPDQVTTYQGHELTARYHRFAHRHRIELVNAYSADSLAASRGRFDGKDFSAASGYEGPGAGVGNTIAPAMASAD